jgi:uncharacterized damage-inducible protein DinB
MQNFYANMFEQIEKQRLYIFETLDALSEDRLSVRPGDQGWTILEVCYHLIRSEELSLMYLKKKLHYKSNLYKSGISHSIRSFLLISSMRVPFKFKAPQRVSEFPDGLNWPELRQKWEEIRVELMELLQEIPEEYTQLLLYKHPAAGRLTISHMMQFFRTHIHRHIKQITKLVDSDTV